MLDLNRFRLYGKLHLPMPLDTNAERRDNPKLIELLRFKTRPSLPYAHPTGHVVKSRDVV